MNSINLNGAWFYVEKKLGKLSEKKRDVNEKGTFKGWFEIKFNGDLYEDGIQYPSGNLIVPIEDELIIQIN
jgi:hypothetical protein